MKVEVKVKSLSRVRLSATLWTVAHHAPPSMGFSRQVFLPSWDLSNPGVELASLALAGGFFTSRTSWEA